ncbi:MAG: bile acid:sodium symporter [Hyphomicrobium sp.]|nr:bile acid:sodium symporter [Hyphomicrobium sp.]
MLQLLIDYAIPANLLILMFIAGTQITVEDFRALRRSPSPVFVGALGQLALLPLIALAIINAIEVNSTIALGILILSLCPGGGISNTYAFLARCNVLLAAMIASIGTVASLATIPLWLRVLPLMPGVHELQSAPASTILGQLLAYMVLPLGLGILARYRAASFIERVALSLRRVSTVLIGIILVTALTTVGPMLADFATEIATAAVLFILSAMLLGSMLGFRMNRRDAPVLVIESGVRNVGVALLLGSAILTGQDFALFASFLTGYFVVEIIIMLTYARVLASRRIGDFA